MYTNEEIVEKLVNICEAHIRPLDPNWNPELAARLWRTFLGGAKAQGHVTYEELQIFEETCNYTRSDFDTIVSLFNTVGVEVHDALPGGYCEAFLSPATTGDIEYNEDDGSISFAFRCAKTWGELKVTNSVAVRFCDTCSREVHLCLTRSEAVQAAKDRRCVTFIDGEFPTLDIR